MSLSITQTVTKYQRHFAKHFLPDYCIGVKLAQVIGDEVRVVARLRALSMLSSKTQKVYLFPKTEVEEWKKNIRLHTFMAGGL